MKKSAVKYTVSVQRKDQALKKVFHQDTFTIGRSLDCDLHLNDNSISRVHIVVSRRWQQIWIEDKNSSNGTFLNGSKIIQGTPVNIVSTDKIQVGKSEYYVSIELHVDESEAVPAQQSTPEPAPTAASSKEEPKELTGTDFKELPVREGLPFPGMTVEEEGSQEETPAPLAQETPVAEASPEPVAMPVAPKAPEQAVTEAVVTEQVQAQATFHAEKLLHEAKKKAAQIVYEGELQAEKRVQSIYQRAQEAKAEADAFYNSKMADAHREADAIINEFQQQGQEMLREARTMAQELREEVDVFVQTMRSRSQKEADHILNEARERADQLKNEILESARKKAEAESEEMLRKARTECEEMVQFATMQTEDSRNQKAENEKDLKALSAELKSIKEEHAAQTKSMKEEHEALVKKLKDEHTALIHKTKDEHAALMAKTKDEYETQSKRMNEELSDLQKQLADVQKQESMVRTQLSTESQELEKIRIELNGKQEQKRALEEQTRGIQEQIARFTSDHRSFEEKKNALIQEYESQKHALKEKLDKEKDQLVKETEEASQHMKLEMNKRIQKLEQDLLEDLMNKKESLGKDLLNVVEARVVKITEAGKWSQISAEVHKEIQDTIEGKVIGLSQAASGSDKKPVDLKKKKRNESLRWISVGMASGIFLFIVSSTAYDMIMSDQSPVKARLEEDARARQAQLEARKFNPPQVPEVKDSYTDAVIYTQDYATVYLDPEFQKSLYRAASAYLLKTWRVDEDSSIQVLSAAGALVKELSDRKASIHPDFVKEGVDKMHALEAETTARMKEILGSEVRLESFRRFERKFVEEEGPKFLAAQSQQSPTQ